MVRTQLLRDKTVKFAGYRRPHPLMKEIEMKVQTTSEKNPSKAVEESCGLLIDHIDQIESKFREAMQSFKGKSFPYAM